MTKIQNFFSESHIGQRLPVNLFRANYWKENFVGVLICALDVFCDNIVFQQEMNKICAWNNNKPFRQNIKGEKKLSYFKIHSEDSQAGGDS